MFGSPISMTVCTGATVNIYEDGKQINELRAKVESLGNQLEWANKQLDNLRTASHQETEAASKQRTALLTIREKLDDLGSNAEASTEFHFLCSVNLLLNQAGFPRKQLPAVVKEG